ncbi:hypothetical protein [Bradyrhizobium sp. McL0616]
MVFIVETDRLEESGTEIEPVSRRQQPNEDDSSAEQHELFESDGL